VKECSDGAVTASSDHDRGGVALAAAAYTLWGLFPVFFHVLAPAGPVEILAHRVLWTLVFMAVLLAVLRGWSAVWSAPPRVWAMVAAAATLIAVNWGLFIYATGIGHVVEIALGYYIGPLVSVLLGVVVLRERLRPAQWVALGIAAAAVLVIAVGDGRIPWLGLGLAVSFSVYGLIKKTIALPAAASLTAEGVVLAPVAAAYLVTLQVVGGGTLTGHGVGHAALLVATGPVTAVPLLLYGAAARRIPLTMVGTLQYIAPTLQFLIGVVAFGEVMPAERWVGFGLVWLALVIFTVDLLRPGARASGAPVVVSDEAAEAR
jgi:chloramphenicol-sensitive protein RarD